MDAEWSTITDVSITFEEIFQVNKLVIPEMLAIKEIAKSVQCIWQWNWIRMGYKTSASFFLKQSHAVIISFSGCPNLQSSPEITDDVFAALVCLQDFL